MTTTKQRLNEKIKLYADKIFPCEQPCDSYGVCDNCSYNKRILGGANLLAPILLEMVEALECNETFHRLGGIDDCKPCLAKGKFEEFLK